MVQDTITGMVAGPVGSDDRYGASPSSTLSTVPGCGPGANETTVDPTVVRSMVPTPSLQASTAQSRTPLSVTM